jgi:hypothetical protein
MKVRVVINAVPSGNTRRTKRKHRPFVLRFMKIVMKGKILQKQSLINVLLLQ